MRKEKEKNPPENEKGFEALLKPIQDVIAKDWKVRLKNYLEQYIQYLHKLGEINFSEAAIIVQNTSTYYCRRVDLMYNWVRQFCMSLNEVSQTEIDTGGTEQEKNENQQKKSKKKENPNCLEEIERINYVQAPKNLRIDPTNLGVERAKFVIIGSNTKAASKAGTSCTVYQLNYEEMGYKEEFRIHLKVMSDGRLYPDFQHSCAYLDKDSDQHEESFSEDAFDDVLEDVNMDRTMDVDPVPPPISPDEPRASSADEILPAENPNNTLDLTNNVRDSEVSLEVEDSQPFMKVIPFASLIIHRKFKKCTVFSLPKELIDETKELQKKKKKRAKNPKTPKESYHLSFSELLGGKSEDMISVRLRKRQSERLLALQKQQKETKAIEAAEANADNVEDDNHFNDFEDGLGDLRDGDYSAPAPGTFDAGLELNLEQAYTDSCRQQLNLKHDNLLTVHKRVAEWHSAIEPALKEAEKRSQFDVHEYGSRILAKFSKIGEKLNFSDVVDTDDQKEVCRFVLSTLMLANTYNVLLELSNPRELSKDCLQLTLLSLVRHHEELDANIGEAAASTN